MIAAQGVSLQYGGRVLFNDVNINFTKGNCYGLIGANGAGKSTFLKILAGELEPNKGSVFITPGERMAVLKQDHFLFDEFDVVECVLYGHKRLYDIRKEKDALYMKEDFTDEDGIKAAELEGEFAELDGWAAESNAEMLLNGLGVTNEFHYAKMKELTGGQKVKVLLAQALFGNPDILLLDEPTNHLDIHAIKWLEDFLMNFENTVIVVSHDRHFLNKVCTNIADIDYGKITMFVGNYDFWYSYTQMTQRQLKDQNKRVEQKIKELQDFIQRFSANASKAKQATSRKKLLDNLQMDTIKPSSRRYPFCSFKQDREVGNDVLLVDGISKTIDGKKVLNDVSFMIRPHEKVAFVGNGFGNPGYIFQQGGGSRIQIHPYLIHAVFHHAIQGFSQLFLVHVMLILPHADRFGIDFHKLRQGILKPSCDGSGASLPHIKIREFFRCQLARGINRRAGFVYNNVLDRHIQLPDQIHDDLLGFPGRRPVSYGYQRYAVFFNQPLQLRLGFRHLILGSCGIDNLRVQHLPGGVHHRQLTPCTEGRIPAKNHLPGNRRLHEKLF